MSAVSSSFSQMKYSRWTKRRAAARSWARRANFSAPVAKISTLAAGRGRALFSCSMALLIPAAAVCPYSRAKRSRAAALRS